MVVMFTSSRRDAFGGINSTSRPSSPVRMEAPYDPGFTNVPCCTHCLLAFGRVRISTFAPGIGFRSGPTTTSSNRFPAASSSFTCAGAPPARKNGNADAATIANEAIEGADAVRERSDLDRNAMMSCSQAYCCRDRFDAGSGLGGSTWASGVSIVGRRFQYELAVALASSARSV